MTDEILGYLWCSKSGPGGELGGCGGGCHQMEAEVLFLKSLFDRHAYGVAGARRENSPAQSQSLHGFYLLVVMGDTIPSARDEGHQSATGSSSKRQRMHMRISAVCSACILQGSRQSNRGLSGCASIRAWTLRYFQVWGPDIFTIG